MPDGGHSFPVESQWDLLVEYGLGEVFSCYWVDIDDVNEVVRRLRADSTSGTSCDFGTAMQSLDTAPKSPLTVWIGEHSPGWSHVLTLSGVMLPSAAIEALSSDRRRVLEAFFIPETGHQHLLYAYGGAYVGDVSPPYHGETVEVEEYTPYGYGLELGDGLDNAEIFERCLCMAGRISGRFFDREWFAATRTLYQIPHGSWRF